jgi:hypothetical protein
MLIRAKETRKMRKMPPEQLPLPFAKRFRPKPAKKKARKKPENLEEWVIFGSDGRVVRTIMATSLAQAIAGLRHKYCLSVGDQGYAKRRSEFPPEIVIRSGMTEAECLGIQERGRVSQSRP